MNANTKNPQTEHCPCPKYNMIKSPNMYKKHLKNKRVKINLSKYATTKQPPISRLPKNIRWSGMRCRIYRLDLYNLKTREKRKI